MRLTAAQHAYTTADTLALLATDRDWRVRGAVAQNPATASAVLSVLAHDREWIVRDSAARS